MFLRPIRSGAATSLKSGLKVNSIAWLLRWILARAGSGLGIVGKAGRFVGD